MFKTKKFAYLTLGLLLIATVLVWLAVFGQSPGNFLEVIFFDIGQGDAIFIETPNGRQVLIDGGPDKTVLEKLNQTMPFYDRTIDLLILTHPDADHLAGLVSVLEYFRIGHIMTSGIKKDTAVYQKWRDLIEERGVPLTIAQAGQRIILQDGIVFEIFWPEQSPEQSLIGSFSKPSNNISVVGRLIYKEAEFLLAGDIEKKIEQYLLEKDWDLKSDVLKVSHHGSKTSSSYNFVKAVDPQISVVSVGVNNRYKQPHPMVLERLKNSIIYQTDKNGDIKISTDGVLFEIKTER
jgi:competence protein ComEC